MICLEGACMTERMRTVSKATNGGRLEVLVVLGNFVSTAVQVLYFILLNLA